jgi:hypothetical protein
MSTPKRAVASTIRKPPELPAAEPIPAAASAFVHGASTPQAPEPSEHRSTGASGHTDTPRLAFSDASTTPPARVEATSALVPGVTRAPKPSSTRASSTRGTKASEHPTEGRGLVERAGGKAARRLVVYVEPDVAKELAHRAVDEETDVSALINEAIRRMLGR